MNLTGKTAIISGGASGLGAAVVRRFFGAGASVLILDNDPARAVALLDSLAAVPQGNGGEAPPRPRFIEADVVDEAGVNAAIGEAQSAFGGVHVLVNCAGINLALRTVQGRNGPHPLDVFETVIRINLIGAFNMTRLAANAMMNHVLAGDEERGVIINVASSAAYDGGSGQAAYAASKGGIVSMTLPIARDLEREGIRVCAFVPGGSVPGASSPAEGTQQAGGSRSGERGGVEESARLIQQLVENPALSGIVRQNDVHAGDMRPGDVGAGG